MNNIISSQEIKTMSSTQLLGMLHFSTKSSLHKKIRLMFDDKIRLGIVYVTKSDTGHVSEYHLPELESKMFVAKHDINYLEMITQFWIDQHKPKEPQLPDFTNPIEAARAWADSQERALLAEKTKAQINDKRTATIMGRLGNATKTIKKLEDQLQDVGTYQSLTASKIPARVDTEMKNNVQSWRLLKQLSSDIQLPPKKVKCERYGEVLAYHVDVIELFKSKYL